MREVQLGNLGESNLLQINNAFKDEVFADPEYVDSLFADARAPQSGATTNVRAQARRSKAKAARENARVKNSVSRGLVLLLAIFAGTIALAFALNLNSNPSALGVLESHKENSLGGRDAQTARNLNDRPIVAQNEKKPYIEIKATNDISWKEDVKFVHQTSRSPIVARFGAHKKINLSYFSLDEDTKRRINAELLRRDERVQCYDGQVKRVLALKRRPKPEPVYNHEIFNEHVFCVSEDGFLVHNHCPGNLKKADRFIRYVSQEELCDMGLPNLGNKIKGEQFFKPHGLKLNKNSNVKNIAEVNGSVFPSRLKASKSKYPFKQTIYVDKDTRDAIAKWGAAIKPCNGHNGTLAIPAEFLAEFNNHIIGLSVIKER